MSEKGLFCGLNKAADPANMTELEKKHTPVIECPETVKAGEPFQVKIKIGEIPHAMDEGHFIQWVEVYFRENFFARLVLTPKFTRPEVTLTLERHSKHSSSTLRVIERCNLHGQWEATKEIKIVH
ncbi:MAG: class II SORL domain-containing protein [Nitrospirota bacterium]